MKASEARELGAVSGRSLRTVTGLVREAHFSVSDTVHGVVRRAFGPAAAPVRVVHDAVTHSVYGLTGLGLSLASRSAGLVAESRLRAEDDARSSVHDGGAAHHALALGLGLLGDRAAAEISSLAQPMHVRRRGRAVPLTPAGIADAYSSCSGFAEAYSAPSSGVADACAARSSGVADACAVPSSGIANALAAPSSGVADACAVPSSEVAVFVHGLFETENAWRLGTPDRPSYAARLRTELGLTPVMLRYNTGLRVSDNGAELRALLADLVRAWPVPVERIVLIGHSMGGLVIHSALAQANDEDDVSWLRLVSDTVTLGSPHHGSPVARGVDRAALALSRQERTRWVSELLGVRSAGVRDMAFGNVVAADWLGHDPDDPADRRTHPSPRAGIRHRAVVGLAGGLLPPRAAEALGDVIVPVASAAHADVESVERRFAGDGVAVVRGAHHLGLLNHPAVHDHLVRWLRQG